LFSRLSRYLSPPLFPVLLRDLPCKPHLHEIGNSRFRAGSFDVQSAYIIHPGPTVGYRVMKEQAVFAYIPDHEPALGGEGIASDPKWISGFDIAQGADVLLHDSQFTREEYMQRRGWGHCSIDDAVAFAAVAQVKQLLLSHYDPNHSDAFLDRMFASCKQNAGSTPALLPGREGLEIEL
jgi:phosphoribosyl 1,2-cyclic phosphodiesterase